MPDVPLNVNETALKDNRFFPAPVPAFTGPCSDILSIPVSTFSGPVPAGWCALLFTLGAVSIT
jgi:hypothetical protein